MKKDLARREFLKKLGLGVGAGLMSGAAYHKLAGQILKTAYAATTTTSLNPAGYYLHLSFPGGPPRWMFDLPLTPNGPAIDGFKAGFFGTAIDKVAGKSRAVYASQAFTIGGQKKYLPPVWGMNLPGGRNLTDVLQNAIMIRGMNNRINAHEISAKQQVAPIFGGTSLTGAMADGSNRPIPAIIDPTTAASGAYRSDKAYAATQINYSGNPALNLLEPFKSWFGSRAIHSDQSRALQGQALSQFENFAKERGLTSSTMGSMYDNAIGLVDENIFALADKWEATLAKYQTLVDAALHPAKGTLPGFFDSTITSGSGIDGSFAIDSTDDTLVTKTDLRNMITPSYSAPNMAENFALAELALDRLTCSLSLGFRGCENLEITEAGAKFDVTHDQHHIGSVVSTVATTLFYRAFIACLNEYVGVLKTNGLFDHTMIHIASEFSRVPNRDDGTGHGASASNSTLISGKIDGFSVIGNVVVNDPFGTYGVSAPFAVGKAGSYNREIQVNDVARTISLMMGVADITTNGMTLLSPGAGSLWTPTFNEAKNVNG